MRQGWLALVVLAMCPIGRADDVSVRLHWLQSVSEVAIVPESDALLLKCANCPAAPFPKALTVTAVGELLKLDLDGGTLGRIEISGRYRLEISGDAPFSVSYPLRITAHDGHLQLVLRMPIEEYVAGVLAWESSHFQSEESLKAMAVVVRTYAARFRGRHQAEGFDFCDTTHCQGLRVSAVRERNREAAEATEGELLWFQGEPARTYYHRDCGGATEDAGRLWPNSRAPYLRGVQDTYCVAKGRVAWSSEITRQELEQALAAAGIVLPSSWESFEVISRTPSGRVERLRIIGRSSITLSAENFRLAIGRALGWERIRSDLYEVRESGERLVFQGYGAGHGVGLCQVGAARMGELGKRHIEILSFYFPGTTLGVTAQGLRWQALGSEHAEVLTLEPKEDETLLPLIEQIIRDAEHQTGWRYAARPQVRVYPSVAAFRNATGRPGWVAASTRGRTIRLQPARVLRANGTLTLTLLHELLHFLIESRAGAGLPLWFREGLVLALTQSGALVANSVTPRRTQELEGALRYAGTREEMRKVYAEAKVLVQSLIAEYGQATVLGWVERGLPPEVRTRLDSAR